MFLCSCFKPNGASKSGLDTLDAPAVNLVPSTITVPQSDGPNNVKSHDSAPTLMSLLVQRCTYAAQKVNAADPSFAEALATAQGLLYITSSTDIKSLYSRHGAAALWSRLDPDPLQHGTAGPLGPPLMLSYKGTGASGMNTLVLLSNPADVKTLVASGKLPSLMQAVVEPQELSGGLHRRLIRPITPASQGKGPAKQTYVYDLTSSELPYSRETGSIVNVDVLDNHAVYKTDQAPAKILDGSAGQPHGVNLNEFTTMIDSLTQQAAELLKGVSAPITTAQPTVRQDANSIGETLVGNDVVHEADIAEEGDKGALARGPAALIAANAGEARPLLGDMTTFVKNAPSGAEHGIDRGIDQFAHSDVKGAGEGVVQQDGVQHGSRSMVAPGPLSADAQQEVLASSGPAVQGSLPAAPATTVHASREAAMAAAVAEVASGRIGSITSGTAPCSPPPSGDMATSTLLAPGSMTTSAPHSAGKTAVSTPPLVPYMTVSDVPSTGHTAVNNVPSSGNQAVSNVPATGIMAVNNVSATVNMVVSNATPAANAGINNVKAATDITASNITTVKPIDGLDSSAGPINVPYGLPVVGPVAPAALAYSLDAMRSGSKNSGSTPMVTATEDEDEFFDARSADLGSRPSSRPSTPSDQPGVSSTAATAASPGHSLADAHFPTSTSAEAYGQNGPLSQAQTQAPPEILQLPITPEGTPQLNPSASLRTKQTIVPALTVPATPYPTPTPSPSPSLPAGLTASQPPTPNPTPNYTPADTPNPSPATSMTALSALALGTAAAGAATAAAVGGSRLGRLASNTSNSAAPRSVQQLEATIPIANQEAAQFPASQTSIAAATIAEHDTAAQNDAAVQKAVNGIKSDAETLQHDATIKAAVAVPNRAAVGIQGDKMSDAAQQDASDGMKFSYSASGSEAASLGTLTSASALDAASMATQQGSLSQATSTTSAVQGATDVAGTPWPSAALPTDTSAIQSQPAVKQPGVPSTDVLDGPTAMTIAHLSDVSHTDIPLNSAEAPQAPQSAPLTPGPAVGTEHTGHHTGSDAGLQTGSEALVDTASSALAAAAAAVAAASQLDSVRSTEVEQKSMSITEPPGINQVNSVNGLQPMVKSRGFDEIQPANDVQPQIRNLAEPSSDDDVAMQPIRAAAAPPGKHISPFVVASPGADTAFGAPTPSVDAVAAEPERKGGMISKLLAGKTTSPSNGAVAAATVGAGAAVGVGAAAAASPGGDANVVNGGGSVPQQRRRWTRKGAAADAQEQPAVEFSVPSDFNMLKANTQESITAAERRAAHAKGVALSTTTEDAGTTGPEQGMATPLIVAPAAQGTVVLHGSDLSAAEITRDAGLPGVDAMSKMNTSTTSHVSQDSNSTTSLKSGGPMGPQGPVGPGNIVSGAATSLFHEGSGQMWTGSSLKSGGSGGHPGPAGGYLGVVRRAPTPMDDFDAFLNTLPAEELQPGDANGDQRLHSQAGSQGSDIFKGTTQGVADVGGTQQGSARGVKDGTGAEQIQKRVPGDAVKDAPVARSSTAAGRQARSRDAAAVGTAAATSTAFASASSSAASRGAVGSKQETTEVLWQRNVKQMATAYGGTQTQAPQSSTSARRAPSSPSGVQPGPAFRGTSPAFRGRGSPGGAVAAAGVLAKRPQQGAFSAEAEDETVGLQLETDKSGRINVRLHAPETPSGSFSKGTEDQLVKIGLTPVGGNLVRLSLQSSVSSELQGSGGSGGSGQLFRKSARAPQPAGRGRGQGRGRGRGRGQQGQAGEPEIQPFKAIGGFFRNLINDISGDDFDARQRMQTASADGAVHTMNQGRGRGRGRGQGQGRGRGSQGQGGAAGPSASTPAADLNMQRM